MNVERLVQMANDIGAFFAADPDREAAIEGIAQHLRRYWAPRMRQRLCAHAEAGGAGLGELPLAAVRRLAGRERAY
jgi:formate dehydrogenase subunit delta